MSTRQQVERELKQELASQGYSVSLLDSWPAQATYYTKDGEAMPGLPANPWSMQRYLARGFTLVPPSGTDMVRCPECSRDCKGDFGLQSHMRTHRKVINDLDDDGKVVAKES
jgi:hypothetical protein